MARSFLLLPVLRGVIDQKATLSLGGLIYVVSLSWNERAGAWSMEIATPSGEVLVSGIPLVLGPKLLTRFADDRLPAGTWFVVDTLDEGVEPSLDSLYVDGRHKLVFSPEAA